MTRTHRLGNWCLCPSNGRLTARLRWELIHKEIINRQLLHDADILIGIFGTRIGTPTVDYLSGTVEEIKRHVADGRTAKVYFSDVPVPPSEINAAQYAQVQGFRDECQSSGLYASFNNIHDFSRDFRHHLDIELNQPRYRWLVVPESSAAEDRVLTPDALRLLVAAVADEGQFVLQEGIDGDRLRIGDDEFIDGSPRSAARWRQAIEELNSAGAVEELTDRIYRVTAVGFEIVDERDESTAEVVNAFDQLQESRILEFLGALDYRQRDLLRFILLQGGSTRSTVIHRAWENKLGGFDFNGLYKPVADGGYISTTQNHVEGFMTLSVNDAVSGPLKKALFPRVENDNTSAFNGV
jgi:hypothetical protein